MKKSVSIFIVTLVSTVSFVQSASYSYDTRGNLVSGDGLYREYDNSNHLVRVRVGDDSSGMLVVNYTWHPLDERVWAKHVYFNGTLNETSYYISETFMQVVNSTGSYNLTYVYQQKDLIGFSENTNKNWNLLDHKGSSTGIMNRSGIVIETTQYEPYGKILTGGATSKLDYEGEENDPTTGMIDFDARMVDPELGMFMQPDTVIQNVYDPQTLNHYTFERNNPYIYEDENGQAFILWHGIGTYVGLRALGYSHFDASSYAIEAMVPDFHSNEAYYNDEFGLQYKDFHLGPETDGMTKDQARQIMQGRAKDFVQSSDARNLHVMGDAVHLGSPGSGPGSSFSDKVKHMIRDLNPLLVVDTAINTYNYVGQALEQSGSGVGGASGNNGGSGSGSRQPTVTVTSKEGQKMQFVASQKMQEKFKQAGLSVSRSSSSSRSSSRRGR